MKNIQIITRATSLYRAFKRLSNRLFRATDRLAPGFYCASFIYLCNSVRPCTYVAPMFSVWVNKDQDLGIFACVVLHDEALLPIGYIIPVGLKADWEERVASKTSCIGKACKVVCTVLLIARRTELRMPVTMSL